MKLQEIKLQNFKYVEALAHVRYWEDAEVNGKEDHEGSLIPLRKGDCWNPIIDLKTGLILNWPKGTCASIYYKVCDAGEYWLLDENQNRIAKWNRYYVPNNIFCPLTEGWGDYIIMNVDETGKIKGWNKPEIENSDWDLL